MKTMARIAAVGGVLAGLWGAGQAEAGLNTWTSGGPAGGTEFETVAIHAPNPATVYAGGGSFNKGAFKSTTGGASWTPINNGLSVPNFAPLVTNAMAVDHQNPNVVYAGTVLAGVFKSTDGGASWNEANGTPKVVGTGVVEMAMDPKNSNVIFVGATGGLFKTANGGATWERKENGLADKYIFAIAIDPQNTSTIYVATQLNQVYKSTNGGESWTPSSSGLPTSPSKVTANALAIDPTNTSIVYAGGSSGGVYKSTNGGASWQVTSQTVLNTVVDSVAVDPANPATVYAGTHGASVFRSTNGGGAWEKISNGMGDEGVRSLAISSSGQCIYAATENGVFQRETIPGGCVPVPVAALLPTSRAVQVGNAATVFATIINPSTTNGIDCGVVLVSGVPVLFSYQTTNAGNVPVGSPNQPANIPAGGAQSYVISLTPQQPINATQVEFAFGCSNTATAASIVGINTLLLYASPTPVADVVALAATATNDGTVHIAGPSGASAFAVATVNVGAGAQVTASVDTGGVALPIALTICLSNPANGQCLTAPAPSVQVPVNANETPTFSVFVFGQGTPVGFDPAVNRVFVRFTAGGATAGATSVAVKTD